MAGRQQNIGGLAISLVADGGQLKSSFEEALRAYSNKKVKITLTAEVDETFKKAIDHLRTQKVDLNLVFSPRRDVMRQLKRDIQAGIENEGGIKLPISPRTFTKAQGQALANEVRAAVGPIDVEMVVNWRWGPSGPPPDFVTRGGGGGPGGPIGGLFFGRVAPSTVERGPTQAVAGANQVGQRPSPAPEAPPEPVVREEPERERRKGALVKREDESDEVYAARLTERLGVLEGRLQSASERTRARANNEMARIEKILGMEQAHARVAVPEKGRLPGDQTLYPERVNEAGQRVRGPASVGPLAGGGGPTDWEKVARLFFENYAKREQPDTLIQGRELELQELRRERTRMEDALRFPQRSSLYRDVVSEISAKERDLAQIQGPGGFRGQRTSTSFFSEGVAPVRAPSERAALVAAGKEPSTMDELIQVLKDAPDQFSDAFLEGMKLVGEGKLGEALSASRGSLADLLARGRAGQIPGVSRGTVSRVLDPTKELQRRPEAPERELAEAQFAFDVETLQDLIGAIGTTQRDITLTQKPKRRRRRKGRGATASEPFESAEEVSAMFERAERRTAGLPPIAEPPAEELRAAGPVEPPPAVPPGTVNFGGAGEPPQGEGGFFFGGGALPVEVINWPGGLKEAGPIAAGTTRLSGDEDFFQGIKSAFGESLHEFLERGGVPTGEARAAKTAKEKEAAEAIRHQRATGFSGAIGQAQLRGIAPTPEEVEQVESAAEAAIQRRIGEQLARTRGAQTFAQQAVELSPARAVATAAGQIATNLPFFGGRSGILERKRTADEAETAEKKSFRTLVDQQRALGELERQQGKVKPDTKAHKQLTDQITQQKVAVDRAEASWRKHATAAESAAKNVAGVTDIMRSFGAGVVGTITGQILFQAALGASQAAVGLISENLGPAVERTLGYQNATNALTKSLSEQTRALHGQEQVAVANLAVQSNLSDAAYEAVKPYLEQRAAIEDANKAYEEQNQIRAAARNLRFGAEQANLPEGVSPGLFQTQGGFNILGVQTPFGGQRPFEELLRERLGQVPALGDALTGGGIGVGALRFAQPAGFAGQGLEERLRVREETLSDVLAGLQDDFRGTGIEWVRATDAMAASTFDATQKLRDAGVQLDPSQLAFEGISLSRRSAALSTADIQFGLARAQAQAGTPSIEALLAAAEPQLKALRFGIDQQLKNQLEIFLPAQRGLQFAAAPISPFGTSFRPEGGVSGLSAGGRTQFAGVPPSVTATFGQYRDEAQRAIDAVNAKAAEGRRVLTEELGVPESTLAELSSLGARIEGISRQQRAIQLDVQYSQFNRQLFIANRTLGDLAGLTGREGATQIGMLQREQLLLGRRSQALQLQGQLLGLQTGELQQQSGELGHQANLLQLELQQRQINFQRAVAGFTAPGTTPEERAARIEEAKVEADYAQRQLDFQKQQSTIQAKQLAINRENLDLQRQGYALAQAQFANQIALQDATNERAFQDQVAAIAEMQKAFDASVQIAALEELKGLLTAQRDALAEEISAQVQAEEEFIKAHAQFTTDLMAQTGEFVVDTVEKVGTVFTRIANEFSRSELGRWLTGYEGGGGGGSINPTGAPGGGGGQRYNAPGFAGRITMPTHMVVGDAGSEEVAILRNPRQVFAAGSPGGGGTYAPISIVVTGNNVSNEAEEDRLAEKVARMVQEELSRRTSTFGLFSAR